MCAAVDLGKGHGVRMKEMLSTGAGRAWLGVALAGLVVVGLVFGLMLIGRLGAGQRVIDKAVPAFSDARVAGTKAGVQTLSQYVDVVDPLLKRRGGGSRDALSLIAYMKRKLGLSTEQVRKILRREAPHTEALTRALPLDGVAAEVPRLTRYLATIMGMTEEDLAAIIESDFPRISQSLTALANTSDAWYDVPGIDGLTRLRGGKPVRTLPGLRKYLRDDVVPLTVSHKEDFQSLASRGGIGYIAFLLLALGVGLLALGVLGARRSRHRAPGVLSWSVVIAIGVLLLVIVVGGQYFPRLRGGQETVTDFEPVFSQQRVRATANGADAIHDAVAFGDPLMTALGGASREAPRLYRFVAQRTGRKSDDVRRAVARRVPQTVALLSAIPLSQVGGEGPRLLAYLEKALHLSRERLEAALRRRAPGLTQALLTMPAVARGWNAIPGTERMTRFDGLEPVRTMPQFDDYLREDLVPVMTGEREDFATLAGGPTRIDVLAPLLFVTAAFLILYGGLMVQFVARRD
jgi:hypothetical protein